MSRTFSFVIALAGLALVVAAPAVGKPVPGPGAQLNSENTGSFKLAVVPTYSTTLPGDTRVGPMEARSNGLHEYWAASSSQSSIAPDAFERAVQAHIASMPSGDGFLAG